MRAEDIAGNPFKLLWIQCPKQLAKNIVIPIPGIRPVEERHLDRHSPFLLTLIASMMALARSSASVSATRYLHPVGGAEGLATNGEIGVKAA